ncbi:hypothetical protein MSG28_014211 [Choristoneura fumiferana]|uniref:Uncharacterized protein n=1 Tax=Choristoneura fumiferana TaxID=7141 RepID=A0ACC0JGD0_CHOFU|nr:hypothetical protein MSG28_014211 [Choristoneura fumiferana]
MTSVVSLLETTVHIISKMKCKRRWGSRSEERTRRVISPESLSLHNPFHNDTRRNIEDTNGGFCEINKTVKVIKHFMTGCSHSNIPNVQSIEVATQLPQDVAKILNESRRIINGEQVTEGRPYMVHLKLPKSNEKKSAYRNWLCGGVIIHEEYILTSAACIEDAEHFYIVSGTYKYANEDDRYNNQCIKNGAKKAIWKCVPKNYVFDGHENDNIRWMNNDIAVVKIEDGFDFTRRVRGCDFVPKPICYNNQSLTLENPGTIATVAGWGTTTKYSDWVSRRALDNQNELLESRVEIIVKNRCKRRWGSRYHNIIDNYMICTKDIGQTMSEICNDEVRRASHVDRVPTNLVMHSAYHNESHYNSSRKHNLQADGGFCESGPTSAMDPSFTPASTRTVSSFPVRFIRTSNLALSHPKHDKEDDIDNEEDREKHKKHGRHDNHSPDSRQFHDRHQSHRGKKDVNDKDDHIDKDDNDIGWEYENKTKVDTRRILYSKTSKRGARPYMVYLQLTKESAKAHKYRGWLCGGVIVDRYYVLTSAACVEDADHFYVVSGTTKFVDSFDYKDNECVCKHRRKVVWKCIPKNYKFDFHDSIKWSSNDIAIVKVNKPFKLGVCEKGCEFATDLVCYNNVSRDLEKPGTKGVIAGWGSGSNFREGVYRRQKPYTPENAKCLQEAKVCIMDNEQCAKKWSQRFRSIITQYMICTKDNDHGGPLIVKYQGKDRVIGVISACKIDPKSHNCHGPFLYTSVFKNRQFISCSIFKDTEESCRRVFRSGITHEEWSVNWDNVKEDDDRDDRADNDDNKDEIEDRDDDEKEKAASDDEDKADDKDESDKDSSKEVLREK